MSLLWNPESWSQRLAELEAQSGDLKEAPQQHPEFDVDPRLRKAYS